MTISSETRKAGPFTGNDVTTAFAFTFKVFAASDLAVVRADLLGAESTLVLDTDYTASINPSQNTDPGGLITLAAPLTTGYALVVTTSLQSLQPTDLTNNGGFFPQVITNALDRLTILVQQLTDRVGRSLKVGITTPVGVSSELPAPSADTLLGWNSAGDAIVNVPTTTSLLGTVLAGTGGSVIVGDDDGSSGSLWTTVRGFITYLRSSLGASLVGFIQSGTGAVAKTAQDKMRESVSVKDFGAVGDGLTDDSLSIQAALDYAATLSSQIEIFFPSGRYYCPNSGGALLRIKSSVTLRGAGMRASVIEFDDSSSTTRRDLLITDTQTAPYGAYDIEIEGIGFNGDWGTVDWTVRSHLMQLYTTGSVKIRNCRFSNGRFMALVAAYGTSAEVTGCEFYKIAVDGIHISDMDNAIVIGNTFKFVNDDSIAVSTQDSATAPLNNGAVITGNIIEDSQGIACLGGKRIVIDGNSLRRIHTRGIYVGLYTETVTGNTAVVSVSITDNVIDTVFSGYDFSTASGGVVYYIAVDSKIPTSNGLGYAGSGNGLGGIVSPYPYFFTNDTDTTAPYIGSWFLNVSGNICTRTLEPTANYSDYGYGLRYGRSGPVNPAITATTLGSAYAQIYIKNSGYYTKISNNLSWGGGRGIYLDGTPASAYLSWKNCFIDGNIVSNWITSGVVIDGEGIVEVTNNKFDGDPLHVNAARAAGGTWGASWADHSAIEFLYCDAVMYGNSFKNVGSITKGTGTSQQSVDSWAGNTAYCNPVSVGYNASNIGIGWPASLRGAILVIEDGDPASATYGRVLNSCPGVATAMPSSGTYMAGHFVRNASMAIDASNMLVLGWARLTTGSGHVSGTDWAVVNASNVSPAT